MSNCSEFVCPETVLGELAAETSAEPDDRRETGSGDGPSLPELLRVVFDIGVVEHEIYLYLVQREYCNTKELSTALERDRSNISRSLDTLRQKGFVDRRRRILESGGHLYQYAARPPEQTQALLIAGLEAWVEGACDRLDEFLTTAAARRQDRVEPVEVLEE